MQIKDALFFVLQGVSHPRELQLFIQEGDSIPLFACPPLPSLPASARKEIKEFSLDLPLFWLLCKRQAARLDAVFSPIFRQTVKAQTETARESGTDSAPVAAAGKHPPLSRCAQPRRSCNVGWRRGKAHRMTTCASTRVCMHAHAHTLVYLLFGSSWERFLSRLGKPTPRNLISLSLEGNP